MFDLFRFVMLRPAGTREPHEIVSTENNSDLQRQLARDRERPSPAAAMEATADRFLEGERAVSSADSLAFGQAYETLSASLGAAVPKDRKALLARITSAFALDAVDLVDEQGFRDDRQRLADTLIAAKLGTPRSDLPLEMIARDLRLVALVQRGADGDPRLDDPDGIRAARDTSIALPPGLLPIEPTTPTAPQTPGARGERGERPPQERERPVDDRARQREQALRDYRELTIAHDYLRDLPPSHMFDPVASATTATGGFDATPTERSSARERGEIGDAVFDAIRELREVVLSRSVVAEADTTAQFASSTARIVQGTGLKISREALTEAPQAVHAGLNAARVDLATTSLSDAVDRINARRSELAPLVLDDLIGASGASARSSNVALVGGQFVPISQVPDLVAREEGKDRG